MNGSNVIRTVHGAKGDKGRCAANSIRLLCLVVVMIGEESYVK
jgi:hypothetical protein